MKNLSARWASHDDYSFRLLLCQAGERPPAGEVPAENHWQTPSVVMITRGDGERGSPAAPAPTVTERAIFLIGRLARVREFDTRGFRLVTLADLQQPALLKKFLDAIAGQGFPLELDTNPHAPLNVAEVQCGHFP